MGSRAAISRHLSLAIPGSTVELWSRRRGVGGIAILVAMTAIAIVGPHFSPHDALRPAGPPQLPPGHGGFLLGTDSIGRDILSRVLEGWRTSWIAAIVVIAAGVVVGGAVGLAAGATGGLVDGLLMRITDGFLALPAPVLSIAIVAALGPGMAHTLLGVAIVWWPFYARIVRGEVRSLAARPHVEAARLAGAGRLRLALRHLLPGVVPTVIVAASLDVGNLVVTLSGLSFLGLGQPAPAAELGADAARNLSFLLDQWWIPVMPALAILIMAMASNIAGDSIRRLFEDR